jgi:predicted DNA-binding protein
MEKQKGYMPLYIMISRDMYEFLQIVSQENQTTKAAIIRALIEEYIEKYDDGIA